MHGTVPFGPTNKFGAWQFKLPQYPFEVKGGKDSATIGKLFTIRMFEELHAMGYNMVVSSDLSRAGDQCSWFFQKVTGERQRLRCIRVAPGQGDRIILLRADDTVRTVVRNAILSQWPSGISHESETNSWGETIVEFKLAGWPWVGQGFESTACRKLIIEIVGVLGQYRYKLSGATNIKGGTDSYIFMYDPEFALNGPGDLAMLSLNRLDRIRLINFDRQVCDTVKMVITRAYQREEPPEADYHGAVEFKLKGHPFHCFGDAAVLTRKLICRLMEALRASGWHCLTSIDLSRRSSDKSVLLFYRCQPARTTCASIALCGDYKMYFVNFSPDMIEVMKQTTLASYLPGFRGEKQRIDNCYEFKLYGYPWGWPSCGALHARSLMLQLLKEAQRRNWHLVASADVSSTFIRQDNRPDIPVDVHSWFLSRPDDETMSLAPPTYQESLVFP